MKRPSRGVGLGVLVRGRDRQRLAELLDRRRERRARLGRVAAVGVGDVEHEPTGAKRASRLAEENVSLALLMAKSRHTSLRSLQKYARPGVDAVAKLTADHDPARRGR